MEIFTLVGTMIGLWAEVGVKSVVAGLAGHT